MHNLLVHMNIALEWIFKFVNNMPYVEYIFVLLKFGFMLMLMLICCEKKIPMHMSWKYKDWA